MCTLWFPSATGFCFLLLKSLVAGCVCFFSSPLTAAQQLLSEEAAGDLERQTTLLCAGEGQQ